MATTKLTHTLSAVDTNGNKKGTFSGWFKRAYYGLTGASNEHVLYNVRTDANNYSRFRFKCV